MPGPVGHLVALRKQAVGSVQKAERRAYRGASVVSPERSTRAVLQRCCDVRRPIAALQ